MAAYGFIVGYVTLWLGWNEIVGAALGTRDGARERTRVGTRCGSATACGGEPYGMVLGCALLPVLALSCAAYYTQSIPTRVNQMLSLMTPALLLVFVLQQLGRLRSLHA